ncbi:VrrA/YqfQ family protein [Bacillus rubiinfantis]|uniref:VrrA/YqfQ family protein n=1 Tax=Bacillus rubiinfantis TaxID=1499680 RepID=UPI0005A78705|nr:VrrA/YqfQ family protein [Bacillus rubiinfantis]
MMPGPRMPMQGGMGQGPFGGRVPMVPHQNPFSSARPPMMGPQRNPFGGLMGGNQPQMGRGGLLSRLFGRATGSGGPAGMMGPFQGMNGMMGGVGQTASGGILQSLSSPGGLSQLLNNTQQIIKTAQTIGPMVQQYGPLVRNLPALWKLYRGFKDLPDQEDKENNSTDTKATDESSNTGVNNVTNKNTQKQTKVKQKSETAPSQPAQVKKGTSTPKLYI